MYCFTRVVFPVPDAPATMTVFEPHLNALSTVSSSSRRSTEATSMRDDEQRLLLDDKTSDCNSDVSLKRSSCTASAFAVNRGTPLLLKDALVQACSRSGALSRSGGTLKRVFSTTHFSFAARAEPNRMRSCGKIWPS